MVAPDGLLLTVNSLLIDARTIRVVMPDGSRYEADIAYRDPEKHLALLRMKFRDEQRITRENLGQSTTPGPFAYFDLYTGMARNASEPLTESTMVSPAIAAGDWVVAAGNAFKVADGAEPVSVTHGVFSTRTKLDARRRVRDFPYRGDVLVIDAVTSNPGAAGGVVVNLDGQLVGLIGRDVISNLTHTHFNYALPLDVLQLFFQEAVTNPECRIATSEGPSEHKAPGSLLGRRSSDDDSLETGSTAGAFLDYGIKMNRAGYRTVLPFVERVRPGSPAARAGLQADDLIQSVNGKSVADLAEFDEQLRLAGPGSSLDLVIRRERRILSIRVEPR
jgi:serine protease Do